MEHAKPKVFFIGFNKTGTTSLHELFASSGYKSYHHNLDGWNLAVNMEKNSLEGKALLAGFDDADVYSDLTYLSDTHYIEGNRYFEALHAEYPNAYFILQTRNEDDWIRSRFNHYLFASRICTALNLPPEAVEPYWRDQWASHTQRAKAHFRDYDRFMCFDIDRDRIEELIEFVKPDFVLDPRFWGKRNQTIDISAETNGGRVEAIGMPGEHQDRR
ncbi:sulfotransferase [Thiocapsa sp. UBA6158]|uniref:sulfotransferase n=1 Tax=Thiocapsa sp. UBA6158 TaxID=1947692 RepID=UPI0025DCCAE6|nr:sulfotransferase [Thiocapsa sp. UBA6158]